MADDTEVVNNGERFPAENVDTVPPTPAVATTCQVPLLHPERLPEVEFHCIAEPLEQAPDGSVETKINLCAGCARRIELKKKKLSIFKSHLTNL